MSIRGARAAVLGAGSWGTALAMHLAEVGHSVSLWGRDPGLVEDMRSRRVNAAYLPDRSFPAGLTPVTAVDEAVAGVRFVVVAVPSHGLREVVRQAAGRTPSDAIFVSATKGLEPGTLRRMSEVVREETGRRFPVVALSGPSFASEVARRCPTALVAASETPEAVQAVQDEFRSANFRLYGSDDLVGVEMGGALKNVIAIAAGTVESLGLGHNAMAALVTRGLAEMSRLACAMGARPSTLAGLSGLGDLVLTCTGGLSRNHYVGRELGRGRPLSEVVDDMKMVAEGVNTAAVALQLGHEWDVELPIAAEVEAVLAGRKTPSEALGCLMLRPQRDEGERE
jgi:glycerol-3-phosphate dehydrogenase (NAD(P)+)